MLTVIVSNNIYRDVIVKKNTSSLLDNMLKLSLISNLFFLFRLFSYGEFKAEDQQKMLDSLNSRVEEVYRSCIGDNEANIRLVHFL